MPSCLAIGAIFAALISPGLISPPIAGATDRQSKSMAESHASFAPIEETRRSSGQPEPHGRLPHWRRSHIRSAPRNLTRFSAPAQGDRAGRRMDAGFPGSGSRAGTRVGTQELGAGALVVLCRA
jgi:hypothetical protein